MWCDPGEIGLRLHKSLAKLICSSEHDHSETPHLDDPCKTCLETVQPIVKPVARAICVAAGHDPTKERLVFLPEAGEAVELLFREAGYRDLPYTTP